MFCSQIPILCATCTATARSNPSKLLTIQDLASSLFCKSSRKCRTSIRLWRLQSLAIITRSNMANQTRSTQSLLLRFTLETHTQNPWNTFKFDLSIHGSLHKRQFFSVKEITMTETKPVCQLPNYCKTSSVRSQYGKTPPRGYSSLFAQFSKQYNHISIVPSELTRPDEKEDIRAWVADHTNINSY